VDKGTKYVAGLLRVQPLHPDHVMFFDFDDLVHRDIARFVNTRPAADGWYLDRGYVYWEGSARVTPVLGFHKLCGTSHIAALRLFDLPDPLSWPASQQEILDVCGEHYVTQILGTHIRTAAYFAQKGCPLEPLPFYGAIWVRGTGENVWSPRGFPSLGGRRVTREIRGDFHLEVPETSLLDELRASVRQTLAVWREARREGSVRSTLVDTVWKGPRRLFGTWRGKEWKL
jgi:hypothetical protein